MRFCLLMLCAMLLSMATCVPAFAEEAAETQTKNSPSQAQQLEPVTVVDENDSRRRDLDLDSITNPYRVEASARFGTQVLTQEEIQDLKPSDVYDLLDKAVGIDVTYQGRKHPFFIQTRGGGSFTYIIDGAVLPPSTDRILYKFPVAAIEEMQIVRGSTALTIGPSIPIGASNSGSGVNTGFVIIRTKQPQKTTATLKGSIEKSTGGHPAATHASLYAGTRYTGSSRWEGYVGGLAAMLDRPSEDSWFDGRSSKNGMINAGGRFGKVNVNLMTYQDRGDFEMQRGIADDGTLSDAKWYYDPLKTKVYSGDMGIHWSPNHSTLFNAFQVDYEQTEHNDSFVSSTTTTKEYEEDTKGFGVRHNSRFGGTLIQLGWQYSNSTGYGPNLSRGYNKYDTTVSGWSTSVEQRLFDGNLILDAGYRQDTKHIDNSSSGRSERQATDDANNDVDMDPSKIFAMGAHLQIADIYALDGRYFYGKQGTTGDFDMRSETGSLDPERQDRIEVALSAAFADYFRPTVTWFRIDTENEKSATDSTYDIDGATYYYYEQSDELRQGIELLISGNIGKNTAYQLTWTHMLKSESTSDGETTDAIGVTSPENSYLATLSHRWGAYKANLSLKIVDGWTRSGSPMGVADEKDLGDYTLLNANIRRDFNIQKCLLSITLFGRNLLDDDYSTRYVTGYYPDRGRTLGAEFSLSF
ncbi:TonB dependent receptor family [Desulfosarcina cetonica]|uniref:TonB-dependent receptor plug domain-containing protein n=1 Tax=Desulfosarcina cetonica TaxID=90730 RepID=UPI0006D069D8|nr:TonB-dependent receptor plug domain-containing protein [Desulfosarcina cetonica]VTR66297.1 TonB dependent receptor family [Desulfosarcina cetonica]